MKDDRDPSPHRVVSSLGELLEGRGMTLVELAARTGVTVANLSVLKNGHARAIRFSTLTAICDALDCRPGDLLDIARSEGEPWHVPSYPLGSSQRAPGRRLQIAPVKTQRDP